MKLKYFRIKNEIYFSMLSALNEQKKVENFYMFVNLKAEQYVMKNNLTLHCTTMSDDYLYKMLKCCGNSFFNKEEKYYYVKPHDLIPIYVMFKAIIIEPESDENLIWLKNVIKNQLNEYGHWTFEEEFSIISDFNVFREEIKKIDKALFHFMKNYYSPKDKQALPVKKRKIIKIKTKK